MDFNKTCYKVRASAIHCKSILNTVVYVLNRILGYSGLLLSRYFRRCLFFSFEANKSVSSALLISKV